jgi:hypothetical protein
MVDDDNACVVLEAATSGEERCGQHEPLGEATNCLTRMVATRNGSDKRRTSFGWASAMPLS